MLGSDRARWSRDPADRPRMSIGVLLMMAAIANIVICLSGLIFVGVTLGGEIRPWRVLVLLVLPIVLSAYVWWRVLRTFKDRGEED